MATTLSEQQVITDKRATEAATERELNAYSWGDIVTIVKQYRRQLITANVIAVVATILSIPIPLLMPLLVDEVLLASPGVIIATINRFIPAAWHGPTAYILLILLLTVALRLGALLFNVLQTRQFAIIAKGLIFRLRQKLVSHLAKVSIAAYETLGSGTVATYFVTDLETIDKFIGTTISKLLVAVLLIIGVAVVLLVIHWPLALLILFVNPVVIYFTMRLGKKVKTLKRNENDAFSVFQQSLTETLDAIHQIRTSNREQHYLSRIIAHASDLKQKGMQCAWKTDTATRLSFFIFLFGFDVFRAVAMLMVLFSDLSIGQMLAVFGYLWFMMSPVQEVLDIQYAFYNATAALKRINQLLALQQEPHYPQLKDPFSKSQTTAVSIRDLHFAYRQGQDILKGINLDIAAGEKIALVGASGGGKSTLVQVLVGVYFANRGMVYYDDVPLTEIGLTTVRDNVAMVLQHPALFNDTVRSNLTMGRNLDDKQLWQAIELAQLTAVVTGLPSGLETIIGRNGVRLSGGERQRLAIARLVLTAPKVVILDEATSALDTETEYHLHMALADFLQDKTTIIVAHRLSAIKQANKVYVFEDGAISEHGSHHELLAKAGLYAKLYGARQAHDYLPKEAINDR